MSEQQIFHFGGETRKIHFAPIPRHHQFQDITGQVINQRLVLGFAGHRNAHRYWHTQCQLCGRVAKVEGGSVKLSSCRCLSVEKTVKRSRTHGMSKSPLYAVWRTMVDRCHNPNQKSYPSYGGRGIKVCLRWQESFENFYEDMGERPSDDHSIDRKDNDGDYTPENCKWATRKEQTAHTRNSKLLTYKGRTQSMAAWCAELDLNYGLIESRMLKGWDVDEAFEFPPMKPHQRPKFRNGVCA